MQSIDLNPHLTVLWTLGLSFSFIMAAIGVGLYSVRIGKSDWLSDFEEILFSIPLGIGIIAYGLFIFGIAGILHFWVILIWCAYLLWFCRREVSGSILKIRQWLVGCALKIRQLSPELKAILLITGAITLLTSLQTLTPPWDADGLIYHLQVPRLWLNAGGIQPLPDFWEANYPMTVELIYAIGLALQSDSFPKVIHFIFAILLALGTYGAARRTLQPRWAWVAPALLIGIPIYPLWASSSYTDMAWAVFEFLSFYALILWRDTPRTRLLILSGLFAGFAMGSKYPALGTAAIIGILILWLSRKQGLKQVVRNGAIFALAAGLIAAPWYIKNVIWFGNPIYPLNFRGLFPTGAPDQLWMEYMWDGFGTGKGLVDYLMIPWNLFAHRERFGTFAGNIEIPSPLFLCVLLYPFVRKNRDLDFIVAFVCLRYATWMFGVQQTRLLLPLFPWLSLLTAEVLTNAFNRTVLRRSTPLIVTGLVGGMLTVTLIYSVLLFVKTRPLGVILGFESKGDFLSRLVDDYPAMQFIKQDLPIQSKVMMLWDGRGYYCDSRCLPDSDHSQWTRLVMDNPDIHAVSDRLRDLDVSHFLFSKGDADFILQHDPSGTHRQALVFFVDRYRAACTKEVYRDDWVTIYENICSG